MTLCRRDLKPAMWCEFEAIGRKANTMRAGPGKISVRKFMQGKSKYYFPNNLLFGALASMSGRANPNIIFPIIFWLARWPTF